MFKEMNIKKVSLWLLIIMVLSFTIAATIFFQSGGYDKTVVQHNIDDSKSFAITGISEIQLSSVSADISVTPVDSNEVTAHLYGNSNSSKTNRYPKLTGKVENNKLIIKVEEPITIGINFAIIKSLKLDISIPKSYIDDLNINTTSGNTYINNSTLNYFQSNTVSGNLKVEGLTSKTSKLSSISGELKLSDFNGDLTAHSVSGNLNVSYTNFDNNIKVGTTSGETTITLPGNAEFYLDYSTVSGDTNCGFPIVSSGHRRNGMIGSIGSNKNQINVSSVSGNLKINKK